MNVVALSAGHHPAARGARFGDLDEHTLATAWCDRIEAELADVVRVRRVPAASLRKKVAFVNDEPTDLAVELHFNACGNCGAKGVETLHAPGSTRGRIAAQTIHDRILQVYPGPDRGVKEGWYRMDFPGRVDYHGDVDGDEQPDYFLARTRPPAVILEPEFIEQYDRVRGTWDDICHEIATGIVVACAELELLR